MPTSDSNTTELDYIALDYTEIFSRFYTKVSAYDFLDLTELQQNEFMCNWLRSVAVKPNMRKLFKTFNIDDEIRQISYTIDYSVDDDTDKEFVIEAFSLGMILSWLSPKIRSIELIGQTYGSTELKYYSESAHLKQLQELEKACKNDFNQLIADRGYFNNKYLDGELTSKSTTT